jgi:hypothetical protein
MNIRNLKQRLINIIIGIFIVSLWGVYAILTEFDFIAFITNPSVISIILILSVPLSFLVAEIFFKDK